MKLNDEQVLSALLATGSIRRAAKMLSCSETVIRSRLAKPDFSKRYQALKDELLTETADFLKTRLTTAVTVLHNIMVDAEVSPQTRLNAADAVLRQTLRYSEFSDVLERIQKLEKQCEMGVKK